MRVFICSIVPKIAVDKNTFSAAGNYFSHKLIDIHCFDKVYSILPPSVPNFRGVESNMIDYIRCNTPIIKNFRVLSTALNCFRIFFRISSNSKVWFYNLTQQNVLIFLLIKYFKPSVRLYVILLDYTPNENRFSLNRFLFDQITSANGVISLVKIEGLRVKNSKVLCGIAETVVYNEPLKEINYNFLLSGILSKNRLPGLIFEVFSQIPDFNLYITGRVDDQDLLNYYTSNFNNIKYLGFLDYDEYINILSQVTFTLNSRDPKYPENQFNFPSKIIEHLSHNKVIISTIEYSELEDFNYFYVVPEFAKFIDFLNNLKYMNSSDLIGNYGNQCEKVSFHFGAHLWKSSFTEIEN